LQKEAVNEEENAANVGWKPFTGSGYRLDGKKARNGGSTSEQPKMGNERKVFFFIN
jgi:hypothetical protein